MPKIFTSKTQKIGEIGEHLAVRYLENKGYKILERNHTRKWGEIDIVASKGQKVFFIEVKSKSGIYKKGDAYRPEDGMHKSKQERLKRVIQTYIMENKLEKEWQFDLITVYINDEAGEAQVKILENVIL